MPRYNAKIAITVLTDEEKDRYDKVTTPSRYVELLEITVSSATLEKLKTIVHAHVDLTEDVHK